VKSCKPIETLLRVVKCMRGRVENCKLIRAKQGEKLYPKTEE